MKRIILGAAALALAAATPAAAQLAGMPVWNSPKGGTGITVSGDYGIPGDDAGGGSAFGARASLGLGRIAFGVGAASWKPDGAGERAASVGGTAAFRVIGGALMPVNLNIIGGVAQTAAITAGTVPVSKFTTIVAGAGASVSLPVPGFSIEPYLSVTNRWNTPEGGSSQSDIGWTIGANVGLGLLGVHLAYDSQDRGGTTGGILGVGVHLGLSVPGL